MKTMNAKKLITDNLLLVVRELTKEHIDLEISISEKAEQGDYYTNVALRLASILKKKPLDIAYEIKSEFEKILPLRQAQGQNDNLIAKIEIAPPGFINFFLSEKYLHGTVDYINKKKGEFGGREKKKKQKKKN